MLPARRDINVCGQMRIASLMNKPKPDIIVAWSNKVHGRSPASIKLGAVTAALWLMLVKSGSGQEFRAAWADVFHVGMGSSAEVDTMVATLVSGHYNVVIVQVLAYMDNSVPSHGAHWKSSILPWSSRVTAGFDPLAYLCQRAHLNGIEVHAWLGGSGGAMYRVSSSFPPVGNSTLASHPEWFIAPLANSEGNSPALIDGIYALDMGSPDVGEYLVSIVRELVTNYPIDGINWDDELNGAGYSAGFGYPAYAQANYTRSVSPAIASIPATGTRPTRTWRGRTGSAATK